MGTIIYLHFWVCYVPTLVALVKRHPQAGIILTLNVGTALTHIAALVFGAAFLFEAFAISLWVAILAWSFFQKLSNGSTALWNTEKRERVRE